MAKRKHPTFKSLRQGQTVYYVIDDSFLYDEKRTKYVIKYFLHSQKTPCPPRGQRIEKLSVSNLKKALRKYNINTKYWFYSKKKAEAAAKR